jgi:release factor glutamine methyltransferase
MTRTSPGEDDLNTLSEWLELLHRSLAQFSDTPNLDGQVLLAQVLERPRAWVMAHPQAELNDEQGARLQSQLQRLEAGEPLPYVLGHWEFYELDFQLNPAVLIPRPETELLVDQGRAWLQANPGRSLAADIGTGSGCIAVSLAAHQPELRVTATDLSAAALETARKNAARHGVARQVHFVQADLLTALRGPFDLICANPPYIPSTELKKLAVFGREPSLALDGGPDGLALTRRLLAQAALILAPAGLLLVEIEASQGNQALSLAGQFFPAAQSEVLADLAGRQRLLRVELSDSTV